MFRKFSFLVPLLFGLLAACSQAPAPRAEASLDLAPTAFGSSESDVATGLAKHGSGVYVVGYTFGNLHGTNKGYGDAFIRKYSAGGSVAWGRQFGTVEGEYNQGVASDGGDNAYIVGTTHGSLAGARGSSDVFLRKYGASGSALWTRQFGTSSEDHAGDVAVYGSSVYVVGHTYGNLAGSSGDADAFLRKYTSSGTVVWTRQFGTGSGTFAADVAADSSGNVYVVGETYGSLAGTNGGGSDMFLRKYSSGGGVLWTKQLHYSDRDTGVAVATSGSNVFLVGGWLYGDSASDPDVRAVKYTTGGSKVWDRSFGPVGRDYVRDASADSSGNLYFSGVSETSFAGPNQGGDDGYVVKLGSSGSWVVEKQLGTPYYDETNAVLARGGEVYAAGSTSGVLGGSNHGGADAYLTRLSGSSGSTAWTDQ